MFDKNDLKKPIITTVTILMLTMGNGISFAQEGSATPITAVDPATGRVVEAAKLLSEMTEQEKAAYSEEDLKILELHELEMKKQTQKPQY